MNQLPLFTTKQTELTSDDWYTPKFIFDALGLRFDVDVACPDGGPWHTPANSYYTQETDGLSSLWKGRVFMNPPYSKPTPWVDKWIAHENGIALMVMTKSHWFEKLWEHDQTAVIYMRQIKFERPGLPRGSASGWSYGLWGIGADNIEAMRQSGLGTVR